MQEIRCSSQEGSSGDVQGLLPPGVGAQNRHDASVVLQRDGDDISIQRLLLLGTAQPQRQAVITPEFNHTRPGRGKASGPVHPSLPRLETPSVLPAAPPFRLHLNARRVVYGMAAGRRMIFIQKCTRSKHLNSPLPGTTINSTRFTLLCRFSGIIRSYPTLYTILPAMSVKIRACLIFKHENMKLLHYYDLKRPTSLELWSFFILAFGENIELQR